ncbi:MAG: MaoC/PaaZ C-terminal domain-containing protein [Pseudomonadota bacterium]
MPPLLPAEGQTASLDFRVTAAEMALFQELSGDFSRIHTDPAFAEAHGFDAPIVYGGLMLAKLSAMLGEHLPGPRGISVSWSITYRKPLYVGEQAVLSFEIASVSAATALVAGRYRIEVGTRLVAEGRTQSIVLAET